MVDRINLILKAKNITPRQFAEEIGIQPSGMSHILAGRNRPSLDFVMKVVSRYPEIDIKWLTLGVGEMFVTPMPTHTEQKPSLDLFSSIEPEVQTKKNDEDKVPAKNDADNSTGADGEMTDEMQDEVWRNLGQVDMVRSGEEKPKKAESDDAANLVREEPKESVMRKKIVKFVVLYDDHTFAEYFPE